MSMNTASWFDLPRAALKNESPGLNPRLSGSMSWPLAARTQPLADRITVTGSAGTRSFSLMAWASLRATMRVRRLSANGPVHDPAGLGRALANDLLEQT